MASEAFSVVGRHRLQNVGQVIPEWPLWPQDQVSQLEWTVAEQVAYSDPAYGTARILHRHATMPTLLHSYGCPLTGCACGCRSRAFSQSSLATKGLRGFGIRPDPTRSPRYLHPQEAGILCTLPVTRTHLSDLKAALCLVGQLAAPLQSLWILAQVQKWAAAHTCHLPVFPHALLAHFKRELVQQRFHQWHVPSMLPGGLLSLRYLTPDAPIFRVKCSGITSVQDLIQAEAPFRPAGFKARVTCHGRLLAPSALLHFSTDIVYVLTLERKRQAPSTLSHPDEDLLDCLISTCLPADSRDLPSAADHSPLRAHCLQALFDAVATDTSPNLQACHDAYTGVRVGEASHPGPPGSLNIGGLDIQSLIGPQILAAIQAKIQEAVDAAVKQALAGLNLSAATANPGCTEPSQTATKLRRKKHLAAKLKAKAKRKAQATAPTPAPAAEVKGKGKGKGNGATSATSATSDPPARQVLVTNDRGQGDPKPANDGWQTVRRKQPEGTFTLRPCDWSSPVVTFEDIPQFIDKVPNGKPIEAVIWIEESHLTLVQNMLRGTGRDYKTLIVFLAKTVDAQRIPGQVGEKLCFRTAVVHQFCSQACVNAPPQPAGLNNKAVKIQPTESATIFLKVPRMFASDAVWGQFSLNANKAAVTWITSQQVRALDTWAWVKEKMRKDAGEQFFGIARVPKVDVELLLSHSGKDGVFIDAARNHAPQAKLEWIVRANKEANQTLFEGALRMSPALGLVFSHGRLAWRSKVADGETAARLWQIDGLAHEWDYDVATKLLHEYFASCTVLSQRKTRLGKCFRFRGQAKVPDKDLIPIIAEYKDVNMTFWATIAHSKTAAVKQQALPRRATPVMPLPEPKLATTVIATPSQEIVNNAEGRPEPTGKRTKQEVRAVPEDLERQATKRDGACVLHAISAGLEWLKDPRDKHPRVLRAQMVEHLRKHKQSYSQEWDGKGPDGTTVPGKNFDAYLSLMESESAYCSELELRALGRILDVKIVLLPAGVHWVPLAFHHKAKRMLVLWFDNNHVDLLLPRDQAKSYPDTYHQITAGPTFSLRAGGPARPQPLCSASSARSIGKSQTVRSGVRAASVFTKPSTCSLSRAARKPGSGPKPKAPNSVFTACTSVPAKRCRTMVPAPASVWTRAPHSVPSQSVVASVGDLAKLETLADEHSSVSADMLALPKADGFHETKRAKGRPRLVEWCRDGHASCRLCPWRRACTDPDKARHLLGKHFRSHHKGHTASGHPPMNQQLPSLVADRCDGPVWWRCPFCPCAISYDAGAAAVPARICRDQLNHKRLCHPRLTWAKWRQASYDHGTAKARITKYSARVSKNLQKNHHLLERFEFFRWPRFKGKRSALVIKFAPAWVCRRCHAPFEQDKAALAHTVNKCPCPANPLRRAGLVRRRLAALAANRRRFEASSAAGTYPQQGLQAFDQAEAIFGRPMSPCF